MEEVSIGEFARRSRLSIKALRLYDELGVLTPARVDAGSGYRYYNTSQLPDARAVSMLRQLEFPLATIKELLTYDQIEAAQRIELLWKEAESAHEFRRDLVDVLVNQLRGKRSIMYEGALRDMPERSVLCLKRNIDEQGAWALGKEFIGIMREKSLPMLEGREGAVFCIYWGEVSADSDGPVEWCRPVPRDRAEELAKQCPELTLRNEPAHREAYVALEVGPNGTSPVQFQLATEALRSWAEGLAITEEKFSISPADLGVRITYLAPVPTTANSVPDCDFAVPFA